MLITSDLTMTRYPIFFSIRERRGINISCFGKLSGVIRFKSFIEVSLRLNSEISSKLTRSFEFINVSIKVTVGAVLSIIDRSEIV